MAEVKYKAIDSKNGDAEAENVDEVHLERLSIAE
jgi:hypothetical protein